ncbi:hypothetical protein MMC06_001934, partial [Schaereria dolodes]|nr:hypothetical protein [Schaereria dolodes]
MHSNIILLLSAAAFTPCISAYREPKGVALYQRDVTPSATLSAAATSTTALASTTSLPPNEFTESFNITLDGQIFPPSIHIEDLNSTTTTDFTIDCINCAITGNISLSGGGDILGDDIKPPLDVQKLPSDFNFKDHWVAATFDNFDAVFELGIELNASSPYNEIVVPIPFTKTLSRTIDILTLSATLNTEIHGWVNTTNDVNLTYGFTLSVPHGSEIIVDLSDLENSTSVGFNQSTLTPIPFNSSRGDPNIDFELSFRPSVVFVVAIDAVVAGASVQLTVDLDIPKLDVGIKQVHNVTSNCDPAPASTPTDQVFRNATILVPSIGFDAIEIFNETAFFLGAHLSGAQHFEQNKSFNLATACYFFDAAKKTMGPAAAAKLSLAAGFRVPFTMALLTMTV